MIDINDIVNGTFGQKRFDCSPKLYDELIEVLHTRELDEEDVKNIVRFLDQSAADLARRVLRTQAIWTDDNSALMIRAGVQARFLRRITKVIK